MSTQSVVLPESGSPVAGGVVQLHHSGVGSLVRPIVLQDALAVQEGILDLTPGHRPFEQLFEHRQVASLEPLALEDAPVLVPAFEELARVERGGSTKTVREISGQIAAANAASSIEGAFELGDVEPDPGVRVHP